MRRLLLGLLLLLPFSMAAHSQSQTFNARAVVNASASGDNTVIAGVAGKSIYVYGFDLSLAQSTTFTLKSGASTSLTGPMTLNAYSKSATYAPAYWVTNPGDNLVINLGSAIQCSGTIWYRQE